MDEWKAHSSQWARTTKNTDWSTGPPARPFTRLLTPLVRSHRLFTCSLTSLTPSLVGQWMIRWLSILCFFFLIWPIVQPWVLGPLLPKPTFLMETHSGLKLYAGDAFISYKKPLPHKQRSQRRERASERVSAQAKQVVRSKRTSERCERTSERTSEWPSTLVCISGYSGP